MRIAICDDKPKERDLLKKHCENLGYSDLLLFSDGKELLEYAQLSSIDLLFLDIEMPGITGLEVKSILEQECPETLIIFCTTHSDAMINAFGKNVVSFLTKPYDRHMIHQCLDRAAGLIKHFTPITIDQKTTVPCHNIIYLHSEQKYTVVYLTGNRSVTSRKAISQWSEELRDFGFCPISRSTIINLKYAFRINDSKIFLKDNMSFPISRRYLQSVKENLNQNMFLP